MHGLQTAMKLEYGEAIDMTYTPAQPAMRRWNRRRF